MKMLVGCVIGLIGSIIVIFFDIKFVHYLFTLVPVSQWAGLVKILIIFIDIWFTAGICILPFIGGLAIGTVLENK